MASPRAKATWWTGRPLLVAALMAAALWASHTGALQRLEALGYGAAARLLPPDRGESLVTVVAIDETALEAYGPWPWPHDRIAGLITRLHAAEPRGIGLLLPLDRPETPAALAGLIAEIDAGEAKIAERLEALAAEPNASPGRERRLEELAGGQERLALIRYWLGRLDTDRDLIDAVARAGDVVLAAWPASSGEPVADGLSPLPEESAGLWYLQPALDWLSAAPRPAQRAWLGPFEGLASAGAGVGAVDPSAWGVDVGVPLVWPGEARAGAGFAALLAARGLAVSRDELAVLRGHALRLGYHTVALSPDGRFVPWPWQAGETGALRVVSAKDVLTGGSLAQLAGQTLVVGLTAPALAPPRAVAGGARLSPAVWMGHAVDSLLRERAIRVPDWFYAAQRLLIAAVAVFLLLLPARLVGGWGGLAISLLLGALLLNAGLLVLVSTQTWLPVVAATLFLWGAHAVLALHARIDAVLRRYHALTAEALSQLGLNLQSQGQLDQAFEQLRKVPATQTLMHHLYQLGHDYERRRQFTKAHAVYEYMAGHDARYRDIQERLQRLKPAAGTGRDLVPATSGTVAPTLVLLDDPSVPKPMIGRYQIESQLGRGAMGVVYLGVDPKIGRKVAIKTLNLAQEFEPAELEEVKMRFYREAEASGRLQHPNIVAVYDIGEEHDLAYIAMDYAPGEGLDQHIRPGRLLAVSEVLSIGAQVADALDYAHRQNVVHRDIKPANIIYDAKTGAIKITDFGIACLTDNTKTKSGTLLGTPAYMSPEQITGERIDGRSDLFSLGVMLYHLLAGKLPFTGDSMAKLVYKITSEKPEDVRKLRPELPAGLSRVLSKALQKDPDKRYQSGANLAAALRRLLEEQEGEDADTDTQLG